MKKFSPSPAFRANATENPRENAQKTPDSLLFDEPDHTEAPAETPPTREAATEKTDKRSFLGAEEMLSVLAAHAAIAERIKRNNKK